MEEARAGSGHRPQSLGRRVTGDDYPLQQRDWHAEACGPRMPASRLRSKRAQEQDQVLFVLGRKLLVVLDDPVGLASGTFVIQDGPGQVRCAAIVQEEYSLAKSP